MNRSNPIPLIYRNENNNCDQYYTTLHNQYSFTGFEVTEASLYEENDFYNDLAQVVPNFHRRDLEKNKYKIYEKSYALWSIHCQKKISTKNFQKIAEELMQNEEKQRGILQLTSFFLAAEYVITVAIVVMNRQITNPMQRRYFNIGVILCFLVTIGVLTVILVHYVGLYSTLNFDSVQVIQFANKEKCSDGVLAEALEYYEKRSRFDQILIRVGYVSTTVVMIPNLISFLFFSDVATIIFQKSYLCIKLRQQWQGT